MVVLEARRGSEMIKRVAAVLCVVALMSGCTREDHARELLGSQGMTEIDITGYRMFICSDDDKFSTGFMAKSVGGKYVSGSVCSGLFGKGATVRYD